MNGLSDKKNKQKIGSNKEASLIVKSKILERLLANSKRIFRKSQIY